MQLPKEVLITSDNKHSCDTKLEELECPSIEETLSTAESVEAADFHEEEMREILKLEVNMVAGRIDVVDARKVLKNALKRLSLMHPEKYEKYSNFYDKARQSLEPNLPKEVLNKHMDSNGIIFNETLGYSP